MPKYAQEGMIEENNDLDDEGKSGKSKAMTSLIAIFIVVIWIAIFALLVKLDVGGFGSSVLYPVLKDVPVINKILPVSTEGTGLNSSRGDTYSTLQEAIDRINELEDELAIYQQGSDANAQKISDLTNEVKRLETYEENQTYFEMLRKKFDEEVVYNDNAPDIEEYRDWYEEMDPDNAAILYRQVLEQLAMDQVIQDLADYYASMKPANAAAVFEEMTGDLEKVANILSGMKSENAAAILAAMDSTLAAKVTLLIYPVSD